MRGLWHSCDAPICGIIRLTSIAWALNVQKFLYGIGGIIVILLIAGFALPAQSRFVVSETIAAHPATVFALVNDLRRSALWLPVTESDPNTQLTFDGTRRGVGATLSWDSAIAGSGTQTISMSRPYERVETIINAGEPGETNTWFEIAGEAGQTDIQWGFEHDYGMNVIGRYIGLIATGVIRRDYERGIVNLKELAESLPSADFSTLDIVETDVAAIPIAYTTARSAPDTAAKSRALGDAYFKVLSFMDRNGLALSGAPVSIAREFTGAEQRFDAGIPVRGITEQTPTAADSVRLGETYAGKVLMVRHLGAYRTLGDTHRKIAAYIAVLGIAQNGDRWESYVTDPAEVAEGELVTEVYYPILDQ